MDWSVNREVERRAARLANMLKRLNVDKGKLVRRDKGGAYAEARGKCLNCCNTRECLAWLDACEPVSKSPGFCPNVSLFEDCRRPPAPDWQI